MDYLRRWLLHAVVIFFGAFAFATLVSIVEMATGATHSAFQVWMALSVCTGGLTALLPGRARQLPRS